MDSSFISNSGRSSTVSTKVSKETREKIKKYSDITGLPQSALASLFINMGVFEFDWLESSLKENFNIDLNKFCAIWDSSHLNYALGNVKKTLASAPHEDRMMFFLALERAKSLKKHIKEVQNEK